MHLTHNLNQWMTVFPVPMDIIACQVKARSIAQKDTTALNQQSFPLNIHALVAFILIQRTPKLRESANLAE